LQVLYKNDYINLIIGYNMQFKKYNVKKLKAFTYILLNKVFTFTTKYAKII